MQIKRLQSVPGSRPGKIKRVTQVHLITSCKRYFQVTKTLNNTALIPVEYSVF